MATTVSPENPWSTTGVDLEVLWSMRMATMVTPEIPQLTTGGDLGSFWSMRIYKCYKNNNIS